MNEAIDYLAKQLQAGGLQRVLCVPASDQSASEAAFRGVPLTSLQAHPQVHTTSERSRTGQLGTSQSSRSRRFKTRTCTLARGLDDAVLHACYVTGAPIRASAHVCSLPGITPNRSQSAML